MSKLNRLIGMASKALGDKNGSGSAGAGGSDWRSVVRSAADALTGDARDTRDEPRPGAGAGAGAGAAAPGRGSVGLTPPGAGAGAGVGAGAGAGSRSAAGGGVTDADRAAIARYDYLVKTADPTQLEQIHREAFARLTPTQRAEVEQRLAGDLPPHERPRSAEPDHLARAATRAEMMRPGSLRGVLARVRGGVGAGGGGGGGARSGALAGVGAGVGVAAAGGLLAAVAGGAVVSVVAAPLLEQAAGLVDFDAIASGIDPETLVSGFDAEALTGGLGEQVSGAADHVSGFGEQLSNFELPNLGDLFGR
ncbi:cation-transporting ATPase [Microbacterium sp. NM3R9]|uniref:cation-transporting ATPase n=1 Tax=Microbacterium thalli TaxID=3027921 RepID=UPI0023661873|nr:cation-transporting ATPase [Microbacterium thalli]MDN8550084.1 cation-transporting ATPase [Microbacterium thalli]